MISREKEIINNWINWNSSQLGQLDTIITIRTEVVMKHKTSMRGSLTVTSSEYQHCRRNGNGMISNISKN